MNKDELLALLDEPTEKPSSNIIGKLLEILSSSNDFSYLTLSLLILRKHKDLVDISALSKVLNIKKEAAKEILCNPQTEVSFPISNGSQTKLNKVYIIKISTAAALILGNVKHFDLQIKTLQKLTSQSFFLMFEDNFEKGSSWMLAAYAAIIARRQEYLNDFIFSGTVYNSGIIGEVEFLKEKQLFAKEAGKILIDHTKISNIEELDYIINNNFLDLPFCIALRPSRTSPSTLQSAIENLNTIKDTIKKHFGITIDSIKKIYGIDDNELIFAIKGNSLEETTWEDLIKEVYLKTINIRNKINKYIVFHFSILGPATFALCFGAIFGAKERFVFYQYLQNEYHPVLNFRNKNIRSLKTITKNFKHIAFEWLKNNNNHLAIIMYLASHNPRGDAEAFLKTKNTQFDTLILYNKDNQGFIDLNDSWEALISEIYSVYNLTKNAHYKQKSLFVSVPVAIAFGLGVALETYENIDIYNYSFEQNGYFLVANLKHLFV